VRKRSFLVFFQSCENIHFSKKSRKLIYNINLLTKKIYCFQKITKESNEQRGTLTWSRPWCSQDLGHLLVGGEELLVLRILEVVLLQVRPELFDALCTVSLGLTAGSGGSFMGWVYPDPFPDIVAEVLDPVILILEQSIR